VSRYGQRAPVDPGIEYAQRIADLEADVAELKRLLAKSPATAWATITLGSANWTQTRTPQWRTNGARIELRGYLTRINGGFTIPSALFTLGSANPPNPGVNYNLVGYAVVAALTPDSTDYGWVVDTGAGTFRTAGTTHPLAIADQVSLDGLWWPA
jgi:hypothetical protein